MLRVLLVSQPTTEGVAVVVRNLAAAGVRAGHSVTVACPSRGDLRRWACQAGADWAPLELVRPPRPSDLCRLVELRSLARAFDVVHLHSSKAGAVGRLALVGMVRRPACAFTPHGWSWFAGGRLSVPIYRTFERLAAPLADVIVAVGDEERHAGTEVLRAAAPRIAVVENGVDLARFRPDGPRLPRSSEPLVTCIGRLTRQKGQDVAVRALARLRHGRAKLRLVGDGPDREALIALADRLGVTDRLELPGAVADTAVEARSADVVVIPSRWEGLSLVLLEAMAAGAAIVATRVVGSSALGDAGVVVADENPSALAAGLDSLLEDPGRRELLGRRARDRAVTRFDVERSMAQTLSLWEELGRLRDGLVGVQRGVLQH